MADAKTILQKYVSDMLSLESHIAQAIGKQVKENQNDTMINGKFTAFTKVTETHVAALRDRLDGLGGAANAPVKEGVAAVLGVAAGLIDKLRSEEISKDLRDDYTALNLSLVSYQMLHVTATALGDQQTADLAARNLKDNAEFVMEIQKIIPDVVVRELKQNHELTLQENAAQKTNEVVAAIWK